jgi:arylsulfatase A-like enzyme/uncharacterized membrane protein YbhN (UPF0104 family)
MPPSPISTTLPLAATPMTMNESAPAPDERGNATNDAAPSDAAPSEASTRVEAPAANPSSPSSRQWIFFAIKAALSVALVAYIYSMVVGRGGEGLARAIATLRWEWVGLALGVHLLQVAFNLGRWQRLLVGQGIHPDTRFLVGSLLIARFFGAVTPGGHLGYGGWRIYDVGQHTKKYARATATIAVEMVVGQLAFGAVVMVGSFFGMRFIGLEGVLAINAVFACIMALGIAFLARPRAFGAIAQRLPAKARVRVQTLIDALSAYEGKSSLVFQALALAIGTHTCHMLLYVCVAQALGAIQLGAGEVFFGSSLQIIATMIPTSINGIGLREAAAVALYTSPAIGVPMAIAVLIPSLGFAVEMLVSITGAPIFLARRAGYAPSIRVDHAEREQAVYASIPDVPVEKLPTVRRGAELGLGAGMIAGLLLGLVEGGLVISGGRTDAWVLAYGAIAYTLFFALAGAGAGAFFSWAKRFLKLEAAAESSAFGAISGLLVAGAGFGIGLFRIRRDVFHEELALVSVRGLGVALACALAAAVLFAALWQTLRLVTETRAMRWLLRTWGGPALAGAVIAVLVPVTLSIGAPARAALPAVTRSAPEGSGNVLVIVVDTLRADHLPSYGYETGRTPNLDAFASDAIRFDQAFSNASWTRPSFASILSGRYASSHGVMAKTDALPGDLTTLAEAYREAGWHTEGVVTNYNVGPYFNFDQGFDSYHYLSPDFVLGADDSAAKLLLVQFLRQRIETIRDRALGVQPGTAYQDASVVNREVLSAIEHAPGDRPWMMFVGYMDPHDPYYAHPYDGEAYSRAAHPNPTPDEAEHLTALYDGEITFWDEHFGALVAELRRRGLYDDMTIVVTADHGEEFCEHGGFFHGTTLYDEQVHVPLFVKLPASRRGGTVVRHWVQSIDIMPTLLRESRVEVPAGVQGASLFEGSDRLFAEESHEGNVLQAVRERRGTDEIKLITANEGNPRRLPSTELFRVDLDPGEQENLADTDAATLEHARRALEAAHVRAGEGAVEGQEVELDDASRRQLCELGYLTGESCEE